MFKQDHTNVVEQVYVNSSEIEQGEWLVVVSATSCTTNCPQKYSLVSENKITNATSLQENQNLLGYYPLKSNADDASTNLNHASKSANIQFINDSYVQFDGIDDYILLPATIRDAVKCDEPYTINFWVKREANGGRLVGLNQVGGLSVEVYSLTNAIVSQGLYTSSNSLIKNRWTMVTLTHDGVCRSSNSKIYVNSDMDALGSYNDVGSYDNNLYLGTLRANYGYLEGEMKEASFWDRELNEYEIKKMYALGLEVEPGTPSNNSGPLPADASLLAHYELDGNCDDRAGTQDCTVYQGQWVSGYQDQAFNLDGVNDYILLTTTLRDAVKCNQEYTINFWVKREGNRGRLVGLCHTGGLSVEYYPTDNSIISQGLKTGAQSFPYNQWMMVTLTHDGVCRSYNSEIYVNGSLGTVGKYNDVGVSEDNLYLGTLRANYGFLDAQFDEVSIWDRQLNGTEISQLYNYGIGYD